jgi:hypothetical protein
VRNTGNTPDTFDITVTNVSFPAGRPSRSTSPMVTHRDRQYGQRHS